ncbi:hypothetical protein BDN67DRAFT_52799 [Paxillus ammoniavirescens]|nr:hypothetical protein BDN67DRAFT_52799 [Paxillus ammoniavirescens]
MSNERLSSSSTSSHLSVVLPPFLRLNIPQQDIDSPQHPEPSRPTVASGSFSRTFHNRIFSRRSGYLEQVAEVTVDDGASPARSPQRKRLVRASTYRLSSSSVTSHIPSPPRSTRGLINSDPPLNVADIPSRSPTNKSPFSAVLLPAEGDEDLEDDPALALWHTEQLHRARLAKLTRHLGEEIPGDMVLAAFPSRGDSCSRVRPRREGRYHYKRRSLDPSVFFQDPPTPDSAEGAGNLRRVRSLWEKDDPHSDSPFIRISSADPQSIDNPWARSPTTNTEFPTDTASHPTPISIVTSHSSETHFEPYANVLGDDAPIERVSVETSSDPSDDVRSETSPPPPHLSRLPPKSRILPRRPATADAARRVEKLANFFGVDHEELSAVAQFRGAAKKLQFSTSSFETAGDLAMDIHAPHSQPEVDVKISKPSRLWNFMDGKATMKGVHPEEIMNKLRRMKAS